MMPQVPSSQLDFTAVLSTSGAVLSSQVKPQTSEKGAFRLTRSKLFPPGTLDTSIAPGRLATSSRTDFQDLKKANGASPVRRKARVAPFGAMPERLRRAGVLYSEGWRGLA